jgi:hypothetical protein
MFSFILGIIAGSAGMYFGSTKVQRNVLIAAYNTNMLLKNQEMLESYVRQEIYRLYVEGKLTKILEQAKEEQRNNLIVDVNDSMISNLLSS